MSTRTIFKPLKGGLGFTTDCVVGMQTETGQFILPDRMALINFVQLPDCYILKTSGGSIVTVDELRRGLRQKQRDETLYPGLAIGLDCQFPTLNAGYYSCFPPSERDLIKAASAYALNQLHYTEPHECRKCEIKEVPDKCLRSRQDQRFYDVKLELLRQGDNFIDAQKVHASVIGSPTNLPYYVTWVILESSSEDSHEIWLDPKTGSILKDGPIDGI